jgi:hypothetical protein
LRIIDLHCYLVVSQRVITASRYSLGTMSEVSPPRLSRFKSSVMSASNYLGGMYLAADRDTLVPSVEQARLMSE